jgi:hypothetical protein
MWRSQPRCSPAPPCPESRQRMLSWKLLSTRSRRTRTARRTCLRAPSSVMAMFRALRRQQQERHREYYQISISVKNNPAYPAALANHLQIYSSKNGSRFCRCCIVQPFSEYMSSTSLDQKHVNGSLTNMLSLNCSSSSRSLLCPLATNRRPTFQAMKINGGELYFRPLQRQTLRPFNAKYWRNYAIYYVQITPIWHGIAALLLACVTNLVFTRATNITT